MKKFMNLFLGIFVLLSAAIGACAQDEKRFDHKEQKTSEADNKEPITSGKEKNVEVMLKIFSAIERRDGQ